MNKPKNKLRVGWFSFTCCEDSTVVFTELMNERWQDWKKLIDFRHARALQTKNILDEMDVAFIEGAVSSAEQAEQVKKIRAKCKMLVAIGSCAVTGLPSSQRNQFDEKTRQEIEFILTRFNHLDKVQPLKEFVTVDAEAPGCPMDPDKFLALLDLALKKFNIQP